MKGTFFCTALLLVCTPALAGTFRHDRSSIQHVELAQEARYQSVGLFTWDEFDPFFEDTFSFSGSGVLISPEWVLTAGHVVGGNDNAGGGVTNFNFTLDGVEIAGVERIVHHGWTATGGDLLAGLDLGLVRLAQPVTHAAPAKLYQGSDELGRVGTIVGYGSTGNGFTGAFLPAGTKRAGPNVIDAIGRTQQTPGGDFFFDYDHDRLLSLDFDSPIDPSVSKLGSSTPLDLEYSGSPGDSGGGVFIEVGDENLVAGITSLGRKRPFDPSFVQSDYGQVSSYIRVSRFIDWIETETGLNLSTPPLGAEFGDFDGDGVVTTGDYERWQSEFGRSVGILTADANGDGIVDGTDYAIWRDAHATARSSASAVAVPEPGGLALLFSAAALAAGRRRRR